MALIAEIINPQADQPISGSAEHPFHGIVALGDTEARVIDHDTGGALLEERAILRTLRQRTLLSLCGSDVEGKPRVARSRIVAHDWCNVDVRWLRARSPPG